MADPALTSRFEAASARATELFNPATDTFTKLTGEGQSLIEARDGAVAATLPGGQVLITGGAGRGGYLASAELFTPATDTFTKLTGAGQSLVKARDRAVAATPPSGQVLIAGGDGAPSSAELFNPAQAQITLVSCTTRTVMGGQHEHCTTELLKSPATIRPWVAALLVCARTPVAG